MSEYYPYPYVYYYPGYGYVPQKLYACPYCGTILALLPGKRWFCPYHGIVSKWKYRFV